jgi:hypothetical protein
MGPEEVDRMPLDRYTAFKRYQNEYVKHMEKAMERRK